MKKIIGMVGAACLVAGSVLSAETASAQDHHWALTIVDDPCGKYESQELGFSMAGVNAILTQEFPRSMVCDGRNVSAEMRQKWMMASILMAMRLQVVIGTRSPDDLVSFSRWNEDFEKRVGEDMMARLSVHVRNGADSSEALRLELVRVHQWLREFGDS